MAPTPTPVSAGRFASYPSLVDRRVFITGGADGIGRALVEQFARQGSRVGFADIQADKGRAVVESCAGARHTPRFYEVDLVDIAALQRVCAAAIADLGGIGVLVNNAASDDRHTWEAMTPEYWDNRINTNLRHYFFAIQAMAPAMIAGGGGSIVNIGSSCYHMQEDFFPGYAIAKSGVEGLTRTMARTFGPHNIRMNAVLPGWVVDRAPARQVVDAGRRGGHAARSGAQAPHLRRRVRPDGAVPRRRRRRGVHGAELPGRWRQILVSGCAARARRGPGAARWPASPDWPGRSGRPSGWPGRTASARRRPGRRARARRRT